MTDNVELLSCLKKEVLENCVFPYTKEVAYVNGFNEGLCLASQKIREELMKIGSTCADAVTNNDIEDEKQQQGFKDGITLVLLTLREILR